ncbi:MAG: ribonuclease HI family protein [Candidatus Aenigmatarchaeota archaeon]|nr:MAG: ribonuclease HI family protein [Candidatus Aenigmarchaeota archaeon]
MNLVIYTDGASRGNPGPGAIAFVILDQKGEILKQRREFIGVCTNNIAEYKALISALTEAKKLGKEVSCFSDSKVMVSQLRGEYKVKKKHLKELFEKVKKIEREFKCVEYSNVRRTDSNIKKVDRMVNEVLNQVA